MNPVAATMLRDALADVIDLPRNGLDSILEKLGLTTSGPKLRGSWHRWSRRNYSRSVTQRRSVNKRNGYSQTPGKLNSWRST